MGRKRLTEHKSIQNLRKSLYVWWFYILNEILLLIFILYFTLKYNLGRVINSYITQVDFIWTLLIYDIYMNHYLIL